MSSTHLKPHICPVNCPRYYTPDYYPPSALRALAEARAEDGGITREYHGMARPCTLLRPPGRPLLLTPGKTARVYTRAYSWSLMLPFHRYTRFTVTTVTRASLLFHAAATYVIENHQRSIVQRVQGANLHSRTAADTQGASRQSSERRASCAAPVPAPCLPRY